MRFDDEPVPGYPLPILPGHVSPGRFERVLRAGWFAVTSELAPPDSADPEDVYTRARVFDGCVDAINATDGSGANCHMSSISVCALLTRAGYAPIMQISCRDKNRIAIQGDILGGAAMGVCNMLCLTGDGVQAGDHPQAKPVFDLDCISLLGIARGLRDEHRFQSGRKVTYAPRVFLGAAANPCGSPLDWRPLRLAKKIEAGAGFIQTQAVYDVKRFAAAMARAREMGLTERAAILPGVIVPTSAGMLKYMNASVPGVEVPEVLIKRLAGAADKRAEAVKMTVELIEELRAVPGIRGIHLQAIEAEERLPEIIAAAGLDKRAK